MLEWKRTNAEVTIPKAEMEKTRNKESHHIFVYGWGSEAALWAPL